MSNDNAGLTNDDINDDLRKDNEDSINFFSGSEITFLHKNISEPVDEELQKEIDGLESLILSFSASKERLTFNKMLSGIEAYDNDLPKKQSLFMKVIDEIINFLKKVGIWIWELLTNRIKRAENRINFLEQRRKNNGIKNIPVKYLASVKMLLMPAVVSESPTWVITAASQGLDFYKKTILAHKKMIEFINAKPLTLENVKEQKKKVLSETGRTIAGSNVTSNGFITDILPGNKLFNITTTITGEQRTPFFFTDTTGFVKLKTEKWTPTPGIIQSGLDLLKEFIKEIKKEQSSTTTLTRNFEQRIKAAKKEANNWTVAYYNWLIEIHRKFISITFQYTMRWFDALENFVTSGVN